MNFRLAGSKATRVHLRELGEGEDHWKTGKADIKFAIMFDDAESSIFFIRFSIDLLIENSPKTGLSVDYVSRFECSKPLTVEEKTSHFVTRNAPAIAFPFLRSYIAHVGLMAGYTPIVLPPINFAGDVVVAVDEPTSDAIGVKD